VYRGLDIGTGKIAKRDMRGVPHHLLDVASPKKRFSAGDYVKAARETYSSILQKTKMPIIVGGTGFYIDALLGRVHLPEVAPDDKLRAKLARKTASQLYATLKRIDPRRAKMMNTPSERSNKVRLIRAIEIARELRGDPQGMSRTPLDIDALWIGMRPSDAGLRERIHKRLRERIKEGMVTEAKRLHRSGLSYRRMRELGLEYRSLARHLRGEITLADMKRELQSDIWRYARKQIGYWKRNREIHWFEPKSRKIIPLVKRWLKK
jgi:tRNA dimethylallyltransferase